MRPIVLAALLLAGCEAELASALDEAQADEVVLALEEAGIGARKEAGGVAEEGRFRVIVSHEDVAAGLAVLRDEELPRERAPGFRELFAERGLVPSAAEERARHASAMAGELARSLETMDGVTRARVHIALPEGGLLDATPAGARASVLIERRPGARVDEGAVRALVAGAVQGLATDDVAVVATERRRAASRERHLVMIGPIAVTQGSATALKVVLTASFTTNLILVVVTVLARARRRAAALPGPGHDAPAREPRTG